MTDPSRRLTVSVIGNARLSEGDPRLQLARATGRILVDSGFCVVTGGMGGVMHAALEGGRSSPHWSPGHCIALIPASDPDGEGVSRAADIVIPTGLDHGRNMIVAQTDAVVAIGGGAGTLSEMALAWAHRRLLIGLRCEGWSGRLAGLRIDERQRYPDIPEDCVYGADAPEEAVALIKSLLPLYGRRHRSIPA